jgi:hypothetical protein
MLISLKFPNIPLRQWYPPEKNILNVSDFSANDLQDLFSFFNEARRRHALQAKVNSTLALAA